MKKLTYRQANSFGLLICCVILALTYYLEYVKNLQPCLLCLIQRGVIISLAIIFLLACLHNPQKRIGRIIYNSITLLITMIGLLAAGRQVWLQTQPSQANDACVPGLGYMLQNFPLKQTLSVIIKGTDACGDIRWTFMQLSLAQWSLIAFIVLALIMLTQLSTRITSEK